METTAPDVTVDVIVGQQIVSATAAPSVSPTPAPGARFTPQPSLPSKKYTSQPLSIYGYGPANSEVTLNGIGVSGQVTAEADGYFRFDSIYSHSSLYPEICLQAQDNENRTTQPVCIPPIPEDKIVPIEVGPVLLSPTLSLSKNNIIEGEQVVVSGYSVPNSKINIYLGKQNRKRSLVPQVHAYYLPEYEVATDETGYYESILPSNSVSTYKLFAAGKMGDAPTSKSNTLNLRVLPKIASFWEFLINLLKSSWMIILLVSELAIIIFLGYHLSKDGKQGQRLTKSKSSKKQIDQKPVVQNKYLEFLKTREIIS